MKHKKIVLATLLSALLFGIVPLSAQTPSVTLHSKSSTVKEVLKAIENATGYNFFWNASDFDPMKKVTVNFENAAVTDVIYAILPDFDCVIDKSKIMLVKKTIPVAAERQMSQSRSFQGVVKDENNEPLIGAALMDQNSNKGFLTDVDGRFSLDGVSFPATFKVSFIGYNEVMLNLTGNESQPFEIVLEPQTNTLDDAVVVGYATMKKRDLVGAVDAVGSEVIGNRANSNLTRSLQGEVAGLNITINDSKPSHGGSYNVRGTTSIGAGGSALVLIDGVEGSLNSVNPQDVGSVSILKDASSTAVYGARGAFGVILVTTKNAQKGRPVVNYNGSVSINRRTVIPDGITDSNEWLDWWIACYNGYYNGSKALLNHIDSKAPYSQAIYDEIKRRKNDPSLTKVIESKDVSGFGYAYLDNHDWMKEFYREAHPSTEHNISVSGGNDFADYYVSGRFYGSQGVYRVGNESFKKYNLRAKGSLKVRPWLRINNNMSMSIDDNYIPMGSTNNSVQRYMQHCLTPMSPLKNLDGSWTPAAGISGYAAFAEGNNYQTDNYIYLRDKVDIEIDILKDVLKFQADYSYNYTGRTKRRVRNFVTYSKSPGVMLTESTSSGDGLTESNYDTRYQATNEYLTWTPRLGEKHSLSGLLGFNMEWSKYRITTSERKGFITGKPSFSLMDGEASVSAGGNEWAYLGAFYRLNYSYLGRYLFELSGRYDGSSKFPNNSRWGFFPSGSFAWRISDERWMGWSRRYLDNLKLRLSAGSMGNGNVSPYMYTSEMAVTKADDFLLDGGLPSYTGIASIVPYSLTWETATTYDVGLDLDMFNSRLSASFDYYIRMTTNMYTKGATLPGVFGGSVPKGNNAELRTNGWELSLMWRDQFKLGGKPFNYSIKGTLWDSESVITKFAGNDGMSLGSVSTLVNGMGSGDYYVGMKVGEMWGYTVEGLFKDYEDIANHATQNYKQTSDKVTRPGQVKFKDLDNSGTIAYGKLTLDDHGDLSIIGNSTPRYRFGLNLAANWNGIGLSLFFQGVGKRDWYPGRDCGYFWGKYSRPFFYFIPSGMALDNPNVAKLNEDGTECLNYDTAYWPRVTTYMANGDANQTTIMNLPNTRYRQSAAYFRLKNIQLDYSFPRKLLNRIGLSGLKIFFNGENLFCLTPLHKWAPNLDPEGIDGGDSDFEASTLNGNSYPIFKSYTFGLNFTF